MKESFSFFLVRKREDVVVPCSCPSGSELQSHRQFPFSSFCLNLSVSFLPSAQKPIELTWAVGTLRANIGVMGRFLKFKLCFSFHLSRYFSVTRPLTYRARRTPRRAGIMIAAAWVISLVMWPPWIYAWPYIEGDRKVPEGKRCLLLLLVFIWLITHKYTAPLGCPVSGGETTRNKPHQLGILRLLPPVVTEARSSSNVIQHINRYIMHVGKGEKTMKKKKRELLLLHRGDRERKGGAFDWGAAA